jgi:hypothetical protein
MQPPLVEEARAAPGESLFDRAQGVAKRSDRRDIQRIAGETGDLGETGSELDANRHVGTLE